MDQTSSTVPLRALAERKGFRIGTCVNEPALRNDAAYCETLAREFNVVTPENAMKFGPLRPTQDRYDFEDADAVVQFAAAHGMAVRGHTLVWHEMVPNWLAKGGFSQDDCVDIVRSHIQTVARHFRGKVVSWDVVNEAIADNAKWRDSFFRQALGPDYIAMAFHWAHEADPDAKLFYNDYLADEVNAKSDAIYNAVKDLLKQGAPIHGMGLQMHLVGAHPPQAQSVASNIRRFRDLGLEVQITEMDVRFREPLSDNDLRRQASVYRQILEICLAEGCTALLMWGFSDRYSWIPGHFKVEGSALIFDADYRPKPAYFALQEALQGPEKQSLFRRVFAKLPRRPR